MVRLEKLLRRSEDGFEPPNDQTRVLILQTVVDENGFKFDPAKTETSSRGVKEWKSAPRSKNRPRETQKYGPLTN
ncbi:hypothetical protein CL631_01960 [bacterium]|nr:hypothetical protein [bacterium]